MVQLSESNSRANPPENCRAAPQPAPNMTVLLKYIIKSNEKAVNFRGVAEAFVWLGVHTTLPRPHAATQISKRAKVIADVHN
jgi:hypothetical protein